MTHTLCGESFCHKGVTVVGQRKHHSVLFSFGNKRPMFKKHSSTVVLTYLGKLVPGSCTTDIRLGLPTSPVPLLCLPVVPHLFI